MDWSEALAVLRLRLGSASQAEIADEIGVNASTVSRWLSEKQPPQKGASRLVGWAQRQAASAPRAPSVVRERSPDYAARVADGATADEKSAIARVMFLEGVLFATASMHEAIVDIHRRARSEPWPPTASAAEVEEALRRDLEDDGDGESGGRTGTG